LLEPLKVSDLQVQEVRDLFTALTAAKDTGKGNRLQLVIKRLNSCYMREDQEDAILDATIGLEILLSDGETQEVTHKLALRLAALSTLVSGFEHQAPNSLSQREEDHLPIPIRGSARG
jgi:hypothetical protein